MRGKLPSLLQRYESQVRTKSLYKALIFSAKEGKGIFEYNSNSNFSDLFMIIIVGGLQHLLSPFAAKKFLLLFPLSSDWQPNWWTVIHRLNTLVLARTKWGKFSIDKFVIKML